MTPTCDKCDGEGDLLPLGNKRSHPCPDCGGSGEAPPTTNPDLMIRHYVSTTLRSSNNQRGTRFLFAASVGIAGFIISFQFLGADPWQSALNASILSLLALAISVAFPHLMSMFRWLITLGLLITIGYTACWFWLM